MNIGSFVLKGSHYEGTLQTLGITVDLTIEPNKNKTEKAPDFKVFHGARETGYAYKESFVAQEDGRVIEFLSLKIDDPCLQFPIYARIYTSNTTRDELALVWSRMKPKAKA